MCAASSCRIKLQHQLQYMEIHQVRTDTGLWIGIIALSTRCLDMLSNGFYSLLVASSSSKVLIYVSKAYPEMFSGLSWLHIVPWMNVHSVIFCRMKISGLVCPRTSRRAGPLGATPICAGRFNVWSRGLWNRGICSVSYWWIAFLCKETKVKRSYPRCVSAHQILNSYLSCRITRNVLGTSSIHRIEASRRIQTVELFPETDRTSMCWNNHNDIGSHPCIGPFGLR